MNTASMREATALELEHWDKLVAANPDGGQILQTRAWGEFKRAHRWAPRYLLSDDERRVAVLMLRHQIPGLGVAFSNNGKQVQRTELIILIRPTIIRDSVDAHFVAEELRTKLRGTIGAVRSTTPDATKYR